MRGVLLFLMLGCYAPSPQPGAPCAGGVCPSGLVCAATGTCERTDVDAAIAPPDAPTTPYLVQTKGGQAAGDALAVTLDAAPQSGRLLVMLGGDPSAPLASVTGGGVFVWTRATRSTVNSNIEVWYGVTDGSSSTVTITLAGFMGVKTAVVTEWANALGLEGASADDGTTSPATTTAVATTAPDSLAIFAVTNFPPNQFGTPGPNAWTEIPFPTPQLSQGQWYRVVPAPTVVKPQVPLTGTLWDAAVVTFRKP